MKAVVAAFNQGKALVGAFSVITNLRMEIFEALEAGVLASLQALVARRRAEGARRPTKASLARRRAVRRMFPHLGSAATRTESGGAGDS